MFGALGIGRNGLHANQYKMDSISDEIANANTNGYKKNKVSFQELLTDKDISVGAKAGVSKIDFKQGIINNTGSKWDLAIEGRGFFSVRNESGNSFLKRDGSFHMTESGDLIDSAGNILKVEYLDNVGDFDKGTVEINSEGTLSSTINNEVVSVGKIPLFMPENVQEMKRAGGNLYTINEGDRIFNSIDNPEMFGTISPGFIEGSNSDLVQAMTEMIITQRAYSLNSQAIQSTDEIMRLINDIKR